MEVVHRVSFNPRRKMDPSSQLREAGIALKQVGESAGPTLAVFEIRESDPMWPDVEAIIASSSIPFTTETRFTEQEIRSSKWVFVRPEFIWGYPMPNMDMGYKQASFDPASECPICGAGMNQTAPLRLKGEPPLRGRAFVGIHWIYAVCARPDVVDCMREGLTGFEESTILKHKDGSPLTTVSQLRFPHTLERGLIDTNLQRENPDCGHTKYLGASRDIYRFSAHSLDDCPDFVQTAQWFGSEHLAVRLLLASSAFANIYMDNAWKGLHLEPIELIRE